MRNQKEEVQERREPSLEELQGKLSLVRARHPLEQKEREDTQRCGEYRGFC